LSNGLKTKSERRERIPIDIRMGNVLCGIAMLLAQKGTPGRKPQAREAPSRTLFDVAQMRQPACRRRAVSFRVSVEEHDTIKAAVKLLGMAMVDYLMSLHARAWEQIQKGNM